METKNINKTGKNFTDVTIQTKTMRSYNTAALIHSKFSSLVSSGTVYSIRYAPSKKRATK